MLAVATDLALVDKLSDEMRKIGYEPMGEFGIEGRRYFRRDNAEGVRTEHVHTFAAGSPHIPRHLAVRDYLRAHPHFAEEYSQLKQRLAASHPTGIDAFMDGKDPFFRRTQTLALEWMTRREPVPPHLPTSQRI